MKRRWLVGLVGCALLVTTGLLVLAGCGGGGGPKTNTNTETGQTPSISAAFQQLLTQGMPAGASATYVGTTKCLSCHNDQYHGSWQNTRHAQVGVGCEQCHGPGSAHVADRTANANPSPAPKDILSFPEVVEPEVCGQCHGPTYDQFKASAHATAVQDVVNAALTNPQGERDCLRCHSGKLRTQYIDMVWTKDQVAGQSQAQAQTDSDNAVKALTSDQLMALAGATHQSPSCVDCHDPHTKTGVLPTDGQEVQLRRSTQQTNPDLAQVGPASTTATHTNWDHNCGTCHNGRTGNGSDTALKSETARPNFHEGPQYNMLAGIIGTASLAPGAVVQNSSHFTAPDQCTHCHMPQARHTMTVSLDISCAPCHTAADAAAREAALKNEVLSDLLVLRTRLESWATAAFGKNADPVIAANAKDFWNYYTLIGDPEDPNTATVQAKAQSIQSQVPTEIRRVRHNYWFIIRDNSYGVHNAPFVRQLISYSQSQLDSLGVSKSVPTVSRNQAALIIQQELRRSKASYRNPQWSDSM